MWDANLALARAAVARGLVRAGDLRELAPLWLGENPRELGALLVERSLLSPTAADSLRSDTAGSAATLITPDPGSGLDATRVVSGGGRPEPAAAPPPTGDRFTLGREIGSGGLGRVVEAADRDLGRTVALKLAHPGAPGHAMERFRAEARITGRLEHPNIVPVHEMGELPTREVYFCMKRIVGRNMQEVIRSGQWRLRRLVEAFRDVCRAVAYAHSRGVIHRDLKPANVMLGDFGETLVVDWGLAKERGAAEVPAGGSGSSSDAMHQSGSKLTVAGDVLGTPSYMPPEQARGKVDDIDERSDVYSLGAMLFEILAGRPPFHGRTQLEILLKVIEEEAPPLEGAPPELAAICRRAMAKKKSERFPGAAELQQAIEAWLEGTLERERRGRLAEEQVSEALASLDRWRQLRAEARAAALRAKELRETVKPSAGAPEKRGTWAAEDRARALEDEAIGAFSAANAALSGALGNAPEHAGARRLRAQLFWERFLEAEEAGDAKGALLNRRLAERFNDGSLDAALRGEGTLAVTARAYGCRCLFDGRDVAPAELVLGGHHLWSGRRVADESDDRPRDLEPAAPLRLRVHGPSCRPAEIPGADVWAFQYVEQDRVLVPITPAHPRTRALANPPPALDALFGNSPYRPAGPGLHLGRTPLAPRPFPMGSWLLVVAADGFEPARVPVEIRRQGDAAPAVTLFRPGEIPAAFLPVRAGEFAWQGDPGYNDTAPGELRTLDDLLLARFPVTCREYSEFLGALSVAEASKRAPRESPGHAASWAHDGKGWPVPTAAWKASVAPELAARTKPLAYAGLDWEEEWPVFGVDWTDAAAYARWAAARDGRLVCLPHEEWWEKGARGPGGRAFPWGPAADPSFSNTNVSQPVSMRVSPVDSFPLDESCYGVRGMGGNVQQWMLNENLRAGRRWQMIRGVSWPQSQGQARSAIRTAATREYVNFTVGFRLAGAVRLGG